MKSMVLLLINITSNYYNNYANGLTVSDVIPPGTVISYAGDLVPPDFMECDGK